MKFTHQLETIEYLDNIIKQFKLEKESTGMKKDQPTNMQNASDEEALDKFKMLGTLKNNWSTAIENK